MLIFKNLNVGYQDSPKVATTSLFGWFHELLYGGSFLEVNKGKVRSKYIHDYFLSGESEYVTIVENDHEFLDQNMFTFAITRDPVRRFLSMYSNRVVHHRELSNQGIVGIELEKNGLLPDPQINELIDRLDEYMAARPSIFHHARPQHDFIGSDLSIYSRLADISEVDVVINEIKEIWRENGLATYADAAKPLRREQTGGPKLGLEVLTSESFERLLDYYKCDYDAIPNLSIERIRKEYLVCRKHNSTPDSIEFPCMTRVSVHPAIEDFWWNLQSKNKAGIDQVLTGAVVIKDGLDRNDFELSVLVDGKTVPCRWGQASPAMENKYKNNINAIAARFSAENVFRRGVKNVSLRLIDADNKSIEIASIQLGS